MTQQQIINHKEQERLASEVQKINSLNKMIDEVYGIKINENDIDKNFINNKNIAEYKIQFIQNINRIAENTDHYLTLISDPHKNYLETQGFRNYIENINEDRINQNQEKDKFNKKQTAILFSSGVLFIENNKLNIHENFKDIIEFDKINKSYLTEKFIKQEKPIFSPLQLLLNITFDDNLDNKLALLENGVSNETLNKLMDDIELRILLENMMRMDNSDIIGEIAGEIAGVIAQNKGNKNAVIAGLIEKAEEAKKQKDIEQQVMKNHILTDNKDKNMAGDLADSYVDSMGLGKT